MTATEAKVREKIIGYCAVALNNDTTVDNRESSFSKSSGFPRIRYGAGLQTRNDGGAQLLRRMDEKFF
jgi:hypothetical protein